MRVLYVVPYSPFRAHDHAASEMIPELVGRLAAKTDLFVYTPGPLSSEERAQAATIGASVVEGPPVHDSRVLDRVGVHPYWQSSAWSSEQREHTRMAILRVAPDVVHGDYLQVGDSISAYPHSLLNYHDVTTDVVLGRLRTSTGVARIYRYAEYIRTRRLESRVTRSIRVPVAVSPPVLTFLKRLNPAARLIRPGVDLPACSWTSNGDGATRLLFTGAMWREANVAAARQLVDQVMPVVWQSRPDAVLRIAGANPPADLVRLREPRVEVVGRVTSLDDEMLAARACIATTVVGGGLLFKALRPMALGCPVVMSRSTADAIGVGAEQAAIADTSAEVAAAAIDLLSNNARARTLGISARRFVARNYRWDETVESFLSAYDDIARSS